MNKDKLISLIIRKQTYKDTKTYLNDILNMKQQAVKASIEAIKQILTTDYNAQAKLYAVRYLKDAFEQANPSFISQVQKVILPILIGISVDENDQKSHIKYAGSSYTKTEQLSKFKAIVSSLFRMIKQCIIKWAQWITDPNRKFSQALNQITRKNVELKFEWKYFRPQNQQLFKKNCEKNGVKINSSQPKPATAQKQQKRQAKDPLILPIQTSLMKLKAASSQKQILKIQNDFNEAINNYLQNSENFKEQLIQEFFDEFERLKKEAKKKIQNNSSKVEQSAAPTPTGDPIPKEKQKSTKKLEQSSLKQLSKQRQTMKIQKIQIPKQIKPEQNIDKQIHSKYKQQLINKPQQKGKKQKIISKTESSNTLNIKVSQKNITQDIKKPQQVVKKTKIQEVRILQQQKIKSPRLKQQVKQKIPMQQQLKKTEYKPISTSNNVKQSKIPTSPKRGPIKFDEQESPFSSQKPSAKDQSKIPSSKQSSHKKQVKLDNSISKSQSQRINFSDEQSSQFSQENHRIQPRDFKKKSQLTPIREQTSRGPPQQSGNKSQMGKSSRMEQQSFSNKQRKGGVTHKLMQQNKHLMEKCQKLTHEYENEVQEKIKLLKQKQKLQKQLRQRIQNQEKMSKKLKNSIPIEDYNRLRKQLEQQRSKRQNLIKQNLKMRNQNQSLIQQLNQTKYRLKNNTQTEKSRHKINQSQSNTLNANLKQPVNKTVVSHVPIIKEQIDQDYIKNLTHTSNLHNLLNKINLSLFKRNVLAHSQIFYRDQYVTIMAKSRVYTQNNEQFVSINLTFQFKSLKQVRPQIKYKNCQQLDLWNKPLIGQQQLYTQQLAIRLHSNPLKVIKAELKIIETIDIPFLLPILYLNFLREQQFSNEQFEEIFIIKSEQLIKSKITQWNTQIIKQVTDIHKLFKNSIVNGQKVRFCLSQGINDQIFMAQFQILRNNKFLLKILPIPYTETMLTKAKQLMQNIIFLLS